MKTIIDELGSSFIESKSPPKSMKYLNNVTDTTKIKDELYIDIEDTNQHISSPTHQKNIYNLNIHKNTNIGLKGKIINPRLIGENENLKDKIAEVEIDDRKSIKYILDVTIAYENGKPLSFLQIVTGIRKPHQTHLLYRLYRSSEVCNSTKIKEMNIFVSHFFITLQVPQEESALIKWLYDRFIEKEALLSNFYDTGSFNYPSEIQPSVIHHDIIRFVFIHLFFIASTYLHFQIISMLCNRIF